MRSIEFGGCCLSLFVGGGVLFSCGCMACICFSLGGLRLVLFLGCVYLLSALEICCYLLYYFVVFGCFCCLSWFVKILCLCCCGLFYWIV